MAAALLWTGAAAWAQQGYRESLAGEAAAAGRRVGEETNYNLRLGPVRLKFDAGLALEYNDNVFASGDDRAREGDLFIRPGLNVGVQWQATPLNQLKLKLGFAYEYSIDDTRRNGVTPFSIAPDSRLSFDLFVGDVRITFYDAISLTNNPSAQSAAASTVGFSEFTNDVGVTFLWDLNDVVLSATLDERTTIYTGTTEQDRGGTDLADGNRSTHSLHLYSSWLLDDTTTLGLQGSAQLSTYEVGPRGQTLLSGGPYVQFQISPYTRLLLAGGGQLSRNTGGASARAEDALAEGRSRRGEDGDDLGYYWSATVINRLNASYNHTLSAGHERVFGVAADYRDIDYVRYDAAWTLIRGLALGGNVGYEDVAQLAGPLQETYRRWAFGVAVGYRFTDHLSAGLRYTFYTQNSDEAARVYRQNITNLSFSYDF